MTGVNLNIVQVPFPRGPAGGALPTLPGAAQRLGFCSELVHRLMEVNMAIAETADEASQLPLRIHLAGFCVKSPALLKGVP